MMNEEKEIEAVAESSVQLEMQPQPITQQPGGQQQLVAIPGINWMPTPQGIENCPAGLEYLSMIDQLLVHQQVEALEALTGVESENRYMVANTIGQQVYYAKEISGWCSRQCCGSNREFDMKIYDNFQREVIHLYRPFKCHCCFFPCCCLQTLEVSSPPGVVIGRIQEECGFFRNSFRIEDAEGNTVLRMTRPMCRCASCRCCCDIAFPVYKEGEDEKVGQIKKQWSGAAKEALTDADNFSVSFPMDLEVRMKAVMLGACFLIDFMYFESSPTKAKAKKVSD
ncbi:hypothetical protein B566_EDAN010089 [Ephemera danica]|nr:hypothetical protein B566_EDAN010089 [Ephemera danica]